MNIKCKLLDFLRSFLNAFRGLKSCLKTERNMRVHLCAGFYVLCFSQFYDFSRGEKALVLLAVGSVLAFELINTAVEACVDLVSPKYHDLAKRAKDVAAGAVLCMAVFVLAIGIEMFWDTLVFKKIYDYFSSHIFMLIAFVISLALWIVFILSVKVTPKIINNKNKDK